MVEIARLLVFAGFAGLAALAAWRRTRLSNNLFLLYTLSASVSIGVTQLDAWPFSTYRLANQTWEGHTRDVWSKVRFFAVDTHGREWELDPEVFAPLHVVTMLFYFRDVFPMLTPQERRELGRFLYARAEATRPALHDGVRIGNERLLGALAAPDWSLYVRHRTASPYPYAGIRVVRDFWRPIELLNDRRAFTRKTELEYWSR